MFVEKYTIYDIKQNFSDILSGSGGKLNYVFIDEKDEENGSSNKVNISKVYDTREDILKILNQVYDRLSNGVYTILPIYIKE